MEQSFKKVSVKLKPVKINNKLFKGRFISAFRGGMVQEVVITYETLYELLKREKERPDLQKLETTFFSDTINYIKDKKKILQAKSDSVFASDEMKKTERQLDNIYKILKELYERREKKIIGLALDKSRTKSNLIDTTALLREEKVFFDAVTGLLDSYRDAILYTVLNEKMPFMQDLEDKDKKPKSDFTTALELKNEGKKSTKLVRFTHKVPKFVGPELEEYGPYNEEDIASLPMEIADVLLNKGKAEEIKEE